MKSTRPPPFRGGRADGCRPISGRDEPGPPRCERLPETPDSCSGGMCRGGIHHPLNPNWAICAMANAPPKSHILSLTLRATGSAAPRRTGIRPWARVATDHKLSPTGIACRHVRGQYWLPRSSLTFGGLSEMPCASYCLCSKILLLYFPRMRRVLDSRRRWWPN
jgi:hypothetical protein